MQKQLNTEKQIDQYLDHLEFLSSKIADNISMGLFDEINKMDYERKKIIHKISAEAANFNHYRKKRLRLVWINNNKMIKTLENKNNQNKKKFNLVKKTVSAYHKHS
ncbi:MAG: hypothetical protein CBC22_07020 [Alphaproteobacteria bacterium TMED62]|nr:MAG: hypothetical protein CBC22_07020 [Alphaproteobacteria bacterium TMED62]|tara:strand:- start:1817 stop:2134 length:318 start_codon:yes stop_codon:yes gene_type:complete